MAEMWSLRCGTVPYEDARRAQKRLEAARQAGEIPDLLLILEHQPVYTKGRRSTADELPMGEDWYRTQGIEITDTDRGGRVTYHGPGQLVGYPIVSLDPYGGDVHEYIRRMERVMIGSLGEWGIEAGLIEGLTGVWVQGSQGVRVGSGGGGVEDEQLPVDARKIGSIGVHVNRGVTTHGFAINVNNDLQPFEWIVPCGIEACRVSSVCRELGEQVDMDAFADTVVNRFADVYGRRAAEIPAAELAERVDGVSALAGEAAAVR